VSFPPLRHLAEILQIKNDFKSDASLREKAKFRIGGVKAFTDGSLGSRTALFFEPYADAPDEYGLPNDIMFPEGNLLRLAHKADNAGMQLIIHAIGDKANAELLDIYEQIVNSNGARDRRWRIEHAQHVRTRDVPRFRQLGAIASMQPYHCIDDARWVEKKIGKERCKNAYMFKTFLENDITIIFGSDWNVAPLNPISGIDAAVNRFPIGETDSWHPEQRISVEEALRAFTVTPPFSVFDENLYGTIEPGKYADCVILSQNIFAIPPEEIIDSVVVGTIFKGRIVYLFDF